MLKEKLQILNKKNYNERFKTVFLVRKISTLSAD